MTDQELKEVLGELINIAFGSATATIADLFDNFPYRLVIVISTILEFKEIEVHGNLFIMFSDEMFVWLEQALTEFLENI
jgi:chemotaxis protein CheY-P-specific phosphatase CheC